jgi:hypothetical protein
VELLNDGVVLVVCSSVNEMEVSMVLVIDPFVLVVCNSVDVVMMVSAEELEAGLSAFMVLAVDEFVYVPRELVVGKVLVSEKLVYAVPSDPVDDVVVASDVFALGVPYEPL